jgi:hypothetical protein
MHDKHTGRILVACLWNRILLSQDFWFQYVRFDAVARCQDVPKGCKHRVLRFVVSKTRALLLPVVVAVEKVEVFEKAYSSNAD